MLKRFFAYVKLWWKSSTLDSYRELTRLKSFDLVAFNDSPSFNDLYFIYSTSDTECNLVRLADYNKNRDGSTFYDANLDKQIVYPYKECQTYLHKIIDRSLKIEEIMCNLSARELNTFSSRMCRISDFDYPVFCWFIDKRDGHVMFIGSKYENGDDTVLIIYDITVALGAGIRHNLPYTHIVKFKDIKDTVCLKTTYGEDLLMLLRNTWRREVLADITKTIFSTIAESEIKYDKYSVTAKPVMCNNLTTKNSSMKTAVCRKENK